MIDRLHRLRRHFDSSSRFRSLVAQIRRTEQAATPDGEPVPQRCDCPRRHPSRRVAALAAAGASPLRPRAAGERQLGRPRPRLRPRGRDERLRRLRLRPARQGLPLHPRPLLHGDHDRDAARAAGRPRPARHRRRRRRLQRRHQRLRAGARPERAATRRTATATRCSCAAPPASRSPTAAASCAPPAPGRSTIAGIGTYRGALETVPTESDAGSLNVVNALAVDQYVKGVIPNESPPSWPTAELKAQAVASRSFALTAGVGGNGFDLYADTRSQVYKGLESEYSTQQRRRRSDPRPGASSTTARSPRPSSPPAPAATPRASRTSSSARPIPYLRASPTPTTANARCTNGRCDSAARKSATSSAPTSTAA